jgi:hypothetical protein
MKLEERIRRYKSGLWLCWIAILEIVAGYPVINGGGMCGGPSNIAGSITLVILGMGSMGGAALGIGGVIRGMGATEGQLGLWSTLSMCVAGLAALAGTFYISVG